MTAAVTSYSHRRKALLNQMLLLATAAAGIHLLLDAVQAQIKITLIDASIVLWLIFLYSLNKRGYTTFARYASILSMSMMLLILGSLIPKENGLHLLFLPLLCVGFIIFDHEQYWTKILISIFILGCYALLEASNFRLFGEAPMLEEEERSSFITNFITSGALIFLSLSYMARANQKAEQHLQQMALEKQEQNQQLVKANEELDRFVYSTSHDLRAPLLSILGLVQLLEKDPPEEPRQPYLNMMRNRINKLTDFINDITNYSRNARLPLQLEPLQLHELVEEVFQNHLFHHDHNIDLRLEISFTETLLLDRKRLVTVLNNLIANAIKYHRLVHPQPQVTVGAERIENQLHLWVRDNGPGIIPEVQARMFDMFYRGDHRSGGSGLGLYIAKEAISKLGGTIKVETTVGEGSSFHIWLPVVEPGNNKQFNAAAG